VEEVAVEVVMKGMVRVVALELAWAWVEWEKEMMGIEAEKEIIKNNDIPIAPMIAL